ncbi:MAG TPA: glycosyltransferase family 39 protein [Candidatus Paceibacterota bacterium]|nr:glycosyltransferase family 39 protein [Candidatus Paceibacterota bacterium]
MFPNIISRFSNAISITLLVFILAVSAVIMLTVSSQETAIMDELAHIPSGYSYDRFLDYRLNPEHPPLAKALAAIPLLFKKLNFPTNQEAWQKEVNGQWAAGTQFIYEVNDAKADSIVFWSRIFPIILTLLLILFTYWWAKKLVGPLWALLPAFLTALSPHILAHGHYVTTDIAAALGFFLGMYGFIRYLMAPSKKRLWLAGIAFGIAMLMKFSTVLLIPLFVFFIIIRWWLRTKESGDKIFSKQSFLRIIKYVLRLVAVMAIGFALVWAVYFLFTINYPPERQLSDTTFILNSFGGGPDPSWQKCLPSSFGIRCLADINLWLSNKPVLRGLGQYMLGVLMVTQRSSGGNTAYFLGDVGNGGWWSYFPTVFALKETIPSLILIALGLLLAIKRFIKNTKKQHQDRLFNYLDLNFAEFAMLSLVIFYWIYSIRSPLNIGFRHILPTIPFIYILTTISIKKWFGGTEIQISSTLISKISSGAKFIITQILKIGVVWLLCVWLIFEVALAYPFYLSYFNEIGGGIWRGYQYVTDSNYDWGQDLGRLGSFVEKNNIDKIAVDFFGGGKVGYYLDEKYVPWESKKGDPAEQGINWIAISINSLQSAKAKPNQDYELKPENTYSFIQNYQTPYARAGTSIFIYKLK